MKRQTVVIVVGLGGVLVAGSTFLVYRQDTEDAPAPPPTFLHCPKCQYERPYDPQFEGKLCPRCRTTLLEASRESIRAGGRKLPALRRSPIAFGLIVLTGLLLAANLYHLWRSRKANDKPENLYLYLRCIKCRRRVRYEAKPIARKILCPTCRVEFTVPAAGPPVPP